jgi:hypothetical protein
MALAECAKCISPIRNPFIEKFHVSFPKICNDLFDNDQLGSSVGANTISYLAARETAHRNDHLVDVVKDVLKDAVRNVAGCEFVQKPLSSTCGELSGKCGG